MAWGVRSCECWMKNEVAHWSVECDVYRPGGVANRVSRQGVE